MLISFDSSQGWIDRALGQIIFQMEDPDRLAHFVEIPGRLFGRGESSLALLAIGIESVFDDPRSAAVFCPAHIGSLSTEKKAPSSASPKREARRVR